MATVDRIAHNPARLCRCAHCEAVWREATRWGLVSTSTTKAGRPIAAAADAALLRKSTMWRDSEGKVVPGTEGWKADKRPKPPIYSGVLCYFPDALEQVALVSKAGNDQHGTTGWDKSMSADEFNSLTRHLLAHGRGNLRDTDGTLHLAKVAWRALAALQRLLEA